MKWYLIFLKRSLVFPILLLSSISLHCSLNNSFLSLHALLWNSAFKWIYIPFSPLPLASLLFSAICKASSDNHFAFLHFFFLEMAFVTASCTMLGTSVHSSSGTLSNLIPWIYLSLPRTIYSLWDECNFVVVGTFFGIIRNYNIWRIERKRVILYTVS